MILHIVFDAFIFFFGIVCGLSVIIKSGEDHNVLKVCKKGKIKWAMPLRSLDGKIIWTMPLRSLNRKGREGINKNKNKKDNK